MAAGTMTKSECVLERRPGTLASVQGRNCIVFAYADERDPTDQGRTRALWLDTDDWADLGSPDAITVTVEPGDLLNA